MSDTTLRFPAGVADGVAAYVREVRVELADLPAEDVDDLTGGMEADLTELAAESGGDLVGRLGSPSEYASELRAAAGLPERAAGSGRRSRPLTQALASSRASFTMLTRQHPWLRSVASFLVTLRPAWWLVRGYLLAWALWSMLLGGSRGFRPLSLKEYLLALVAVVISVQVGRGWLHQRAALRPLLAVVNVGALLVAVMAWGSSAGTYYQASPYSPPAGVSLDGAQVGNIYAYDADGKRVTSVRLFAEGGQPLGGGDQAFGPNGNPVDVVRDSSGAPVTNVYPRALFGQDPWQVIDPAASDANQGQWTPPMAIVPLMPHPTPTSPPTSTTTGTATSPAPSGSARPTPSSGPSPSVTRSGR
jgi:hypothetical protein